MFFKLDNEDAEFTNWNTPTERHGPEKLEQACDLKMKVSMHNSRLEMLHPKLSAFLFDFNEEDEEGDQESLDVGEKGRTKLSCKTLQPLKFGYQAAGYRVSMGYGLTDKNHTQFIDVSFKEIVITAKEGGSVELVFSLRVHPEGSQLEYMSSMLCNKRVQITLTPPSPERQAQIELDELAESIDDGNDLDLA